MSQTFVLSQAESQAAEKVLVSLGYNELTMMEQVAAQMARLVAKQLKKSNKDLGLVALVGPGNNGADTLALIRLTKLRHEKLFNERITQLKVFQWPAKSKSRLRLLQEKLFLQSFNDERLTDFSLTSIKELSTFPRNGLLLDGVFGSGYEFRELNTDEKSSLKELSKVLDSRSYLKIAIDVPSGLMQDGRRVTAFTGLKADCSYCVAGPKLSQIHSDGVEQSGRLLTVDLGLETKSGSFAWVDAKSYRFSLKEIPKSAHKNTRGRVLVVGGSLKGGGATRLAARAALQMGAGFAGVVDWVRTRESVEDFGEWLSHDFPLDLSSWTKLLNSYDRVVFGCGLPSGGIPKVDEKNWANFFKALENFPRDRTIVVDGGGLVSYFRWWKTLKVKPGASLVITPHPGEAKELLNVLSPAVKAATRLELFSALSAALRAKSFGGCLLLKGAYPLSINLEKSERGECWNIASEKLATAGSGDVLAGAIAGLSLRSSPYSALKAALWAQARALRSLKMGSLATEISTEMFRAIAAR